jgi:hypothetical protein
MATARVFECIRAGLTSPTRSLPSRRVIAFDSVNSGRAETRKVTKAGRVLSVADDKSGSASVLIIFDGLKEPTRLHWTYIERIDHSAKDHD